MLESDRNFVSSDEAGEYRDRAGTRSDGDVADVEFHENIFSDEDATASQGEQNVWHEQEKGANRRRETGSKKMLERWKSWRKKQKQKEQKNDLQDFLAQDGSNVFISQLQRLNRRLDRNNVKWPIFKSSKSKTQKKIRCGKYGSRQFGARATHLGARRNLGWTV